MLIEARKIDDNGFITEFIVVNSERIPEGYITVQPNGLTKPRWTGSEWVEAITQEELDAMMAEQEQIQPTVPLEERIAQLEAKNAELEATLNALFGV